MKVEKPVIHVLLLAMLWSPLAGSGTPCRQADRANVRQLAAVSEKTERVSPHQHHGKLKRAENSVVAHHAVVPRDSELSEECPCCDDCAAVCLVSGFTPAFVNNAALSLSFDRESSDPPRTDAFPAGPIFPPLFRPPISHS